jgi:hypothetical protein
MDRPQEKRPEHQALETLGILAFFCLFFGVIFDVDTLSYAALGLLFIGLFIKRLALVIAGGWLKFAAALGTANTKIILFVIFYLFLTPIAFLYRLTHGDVMNLKDENPPQESFWKERNHQYKPEDIEKQW